MTRFNSINNSQGCSNRRKQTETQCAWVISILINHIIYIPNFIVNRQQHVKGKLDEKWFHKRKIRQCQKNICVVKFYFCALKDFWSVILERECVKPWLVIILKFEPKYFSRSFEIIEFWFSTTLSSTDHFWGSKTKLLSHRSII